LIQHDDVCCFHETLKLPWYSVAEKKVGPVATEKGEGILALSFIF
jgi:hypothetical protein